MLAAASRTGAYWAAARGAPATRSQCVQAATGGDSVQPGAERGASLEPAQSWSQLLAFAEVTGIPRHALKGRPMSALEFAAALRRRWYVLALAGLFTLVGMWAVHVRPVSYQGCEGLYFAVASPGGNVYLEDFPSPAVMTGMVTQTMMSQPMQQRMQAGGVTDYAVTQTNSGEIRFPFYTLPTMQACATSATPQGTVSAAQLVTAGIRSVLHQMQAAQHAPADSFITAVQLTPAVPVPIIGRPHLAYLGVLLIGAVTAVPLALWSDPLFRYLERRRRAA